MPLSCSSVSDSTGLPALTMNTSASMAKGSILISKPASFISPNTVSLGSAAMTRSRFPRISSRYDSVVREKSMRSDTSSSLSPRSTAAIALPSGAVAVEPSRRGKFSRVKLTWLASGVGEGWASGAPHAASSAKARASAAHISLRLIFCTSI